MRAAFADTLINLALADKRVTLLVGDFCFGTFDGLKAQRPEQYWNLGTCEQTMVGIAAGMAIEGLIPVVYTITPFLLERAYEQIKLDVDQQNVKVILAGFDDYPKDGPTHKCNSPITLCSLFRNIHFYGPVAADDARKALTDAYEKSWPSFIHLRNAPPKVATEWPAAGSEA